jgi:hypothetical protein
MALPRDRKAVKRQRETTCFITPDDLLAHEADSLQQMAVAPWPARLTWWKQTLLAASKRAKNEGVLDAYVWFEAHDPRASANDPNHFIELGAQILPGNPPLISYFFAIGESDTNSGRCGLRKLHFDLNVSSESAEPKPGMHVQLAGRTPPCLSPFYAAGAFEHLKPKLDKPRVPCLPKSFALVAHLALLEYQTTDESLKTFLSDSKWISIVKASEEALLKPHFGYCCDWLARAENESRSLLSHFYGLPRP